VDQDYTKGGIFEGGNGNAITVKAGNFLNIRRWLTVTGRSFPHRFN